jgi:hypothetical protein
MDTRQKDAKETQAGATDAKGEWFLASLPGDRNWT